MHRKEIDFHRVVSVDRPMRCIVEYEEELVVIHRSELLIVELERFLTENNESITGTMKTRKTYKGSLLSGDRRRVTCIIQANERVFFRICRE